jgi:hypothetical protein
LTPATIRESLKQTGYKSVGTKQKLVKTYEEAVNDIGIRIFGERLSEEQVKAVAKLLKVDAPGDNQTLLGAVVEKVQSETIYKVLEKSDDVLFNQFLNVLGLETEPSDTKILMIKQVADEVMLLGMEGFLNKLNPTLLKNYCTELKLPSTGEKSVLVDRIMEHMFELELNI